MKTTTWRATPEQLDVEQREAQGKIRRERPLAEQRAILAPKEME
jgi:hypothetical protein